VTEHNTAEDALHAILSKVYTSGAASVQAGWSQVLGAEPTDVEWGIRHSEVTGLIRTLLVQVQSLPDEEPARERTLRYSPNWYRAIVWDGHSQSHQEPAAGILSQGDLDHLASTAELLRYQLPGTATARNGDALAGLRGEVDDWITVLSTATDLPDGLRTEILGQMRHIQWLLDNMGMFGTGPVVREAEVAVGKISEALFTRIRDAATKGIWLKKLGTFVVALGLVNQGVGDTQQVLDTAKHTIGIVQQIIEQGEQSSIFQDLELL